MEMGILYGRRKKYAILSRQKRKKGTSTEELIFILYDDNGVPVYEISNFLDVSIRHVEEVLSDD